MKKILSFILVFCLVVGLIPTLPISASAETEGAYTYTLSDGKATITAFDSSYAGTLVIPSTLGGYPVTSIGNSAFYNCRNLVSVTIPNSLTSIGDNAFDYCTSLISITIPGSVISIGNSVFSRCTSLTSITIPNSVISIGNSVFEYCSALNSIIIGNSVTSIGDNAFISCLDLTAITIPDSVTSIGDNAFDNCPNLVSITVTENNPSYCSIDGVLYNKDKTTLIKNPMKNTHTNYIIPSSVTLINDGAFECCYDLESITIPNSVTFIGDSAFRWCESLTSIIIPNSVTHIGNNAFEWCSSLTSITIPDSVSSIGDETFLGCEKLISITIPDSITSIGNAAFSSCQSLTSITIPSSISSISTSTFRSCIGLVSVTLPKSIELIENMAFDGCSSLADVYYAGTEDEWESIAIASSNTPLENATIHYNYVIEEPTEVPAPGFEVGDANKSKNDKVPNAFFYEITVTNEEGAELISLTVSYAPEGKTATVTELNLSGMSGVNLKFASVLRGIPLEHYDTAINGSFSFTYRINGENKTVTVTKTTTYNQAK